MLLFAAQNGHSEGEPNGNGEVRGIIFFLYDNIVTNGPGINQYLSLISIHYFYDCCIIIVNLYGLVFHIMCSSNGQVGYGDHNHARWAFHIASAPILPFRLLGMCLLEATNLCKEYLRYGCLLLEGLSDIYLKLFRLKNDFF